MLVNNLKGMKNMSDQVTNENENEVNDKNYPEVMTVAEVKADAGTFQANVAAATEGVDEARVFTSFNQLDDLHDGWEVVTSVRDSGKYKESPAVFVYQQPTMDSLLELGERGREFIEDCISATLGRKSGALAAAVNKADFDGKFSMPKTLGEWMEGAKTASTGRKALGKRGWNMVSGMFVAAINAQYKAQGYGGMMNKKDLMLCLSDASHAAVAHSKIKPAAWANILTQAKNQITELAKVPENELDVARDTKIIQHWIDTRDVVETDMDFEITELVLEVDEAGTTEG